MSQTPPDFIEVYEDAVSREFCAAVVAKFEASGAEQPGRIGSGVVKQKKDSADITISGIPDWREVELALNRAVLAALAKYVRRYPHTLIAPLATWVPDPQGGAPLEVTEQRLGELAEARLGVLLQNAFRPGRVNLQRYRSDTGGYPYWHCELFPQSADAEQLHRHVLWTLYLNDGFREGETEFLYQRRKIVPKTGRLVIAPTAFTHTHRGNTPRGGDKYIATSWILFRRAETIFGGTLRA